MLVKDIVAGVNTKLAGETLTLNQLRLFLDEAVDMINRELSACFPSFDTLATGDTYDAIPDKYIRSCIICGAAYKFYETDEEGIVTATQYMYDFMDNLFYMKRDYSHRIPEIYREDNQGFIIGPNINNTLETGWGGW